MPVVTRPVPPLQRHPETPMYSGMGEGSQDRRRIAATADDGRVGARRRGRVVLFTSMTALGATLFPLAFGLSGHPRSAFVAGLMASGTVATAGGTALIAWWWRSRRQDPVHNAFPSLIGAAMVVRGAAELWSLVGALDGGAGRPLRGDSLAFWAAPLIMLAVLCIPRRAASALPGVRLALDALAVGGGTIMLLWNTLLTTPGEEFSPRLGLTGAFLLTECTVVAAIILISVFNLRSRIWPAALGVLCQVIGDFGAVLAEGAAGSRWHLWMSTVLWCLAWPLIYLGSLRFRRVTAPVGQGARDRGEAVAVQVTTLITFATLTFAMITGQGLIGTDAGPAGSVLMLMLMGPLLCTREIMNTHFRLKLTADLRAEALRDALTGLPNRQALIARIADLDAHDGSGVVLTLDLDGFKQVNDLLGHEAGDSLLIAVSVALREQCPRTALIARTGGDEFAVLVAADPDLERQSADLTEGRRLAERLRTAVGRALDLKAQGVGISASVGVGRLVRRPTGTTAVAEHRDALSALVESAAALRAAKEAGSDPVQVYDGLVASARHRRLLLEHRLRHAIANRSVITYGQPIIDLGTGRLTGFESLARWHDQELGFVPPDEFIAVAEQTGLVVALGEHLLEETVCAASAAGVFAAGLTLSVNASPIQLRVPGFVELIRDVTTRYRVRPEQIIVEITEAILVAEGDAAVSTLAELHTLGIGLAIDDFGTGYSALGYLRRLPVQLIKIDKSLTVSLLSEPKTVAIVDGVVRMAHRMGIKVVMEGIEDELEADSCRMVGADRGQGYLFGRPVPWDEAAQRVTAMTRSGNDDPRPATGHTWGSSS